MSGIAGWCPLEQLSAPRGQCGVYSIQCTIHSELITVCSTQYTVNSRERERGGERERENNPEIERGGDR